MEQLLNKEFIKNIERLLYKEALLPFTVKNISTYISFHVKKIIKKTLEKLLKPPHSTRSRVSSRYRRNHRHCSYKNSSPTLWCFPLFCYPLGASLNMLMNYPKSGPWTNNLMNGRSLQDRIAMSEHAFPFLNFTHGACLNRGSFNYLASRRTRRHFLLTVSGNNSTGRVCAARKKGRMKIA